ncbi:hypothetical protein ABT115_08760 [Streptomyces sp. NPDC001832]|uniref:hypothetical protein n=1 Tax=Streptomyces sp. NPDC001832 TaxID=3154527 RepID=UPI00332CB23A
MARNIFAGTAAEVAEDVSGARIPNAVGTVWDGPSGGASQVLDLLSSELTPIAELVANDHGMVPAFWGPDNGSERLWVDFGSGRVALVANNLAERLKSHLEASDPHGDRAAILALLGVPTGIATLAEDGRVTPSQLPEFAGGEQSVSSVNGYVGDVILDAEDVKASPEDHTHTPAQVGSAPADHTHTAEAIGAFPITGGTLDGAVNANATSAFPNIRLGGVSTNLAGGSGSIIAMEDATTVPNATPTSVVQYAEGGRFKLRQRDGKVITPVNMPGTWQPDDYGLAAWSYDLHESSRTPGDRPSEAGRLYLVGVPVRTKTTVSKVSCHVMGFDKPNSTVTSAYMGIYDKDLTRLALTADIKAMFPETHNTGGQMATFNLTNSVSLNPGSYYIAILVKGPGTSVPYLAATNWGSTATTSGAKAADVNGVHRWLQTTSTTLTTLPTSLTMVDMADGMTCYWAGLG